ncbi:DUF2929 family protein [Sporosarcina sp. CAU 1771]
MRFIITLVWSLILVTMLNYVTGAIANTNPFDFVSGAIASVFLALFIFIIGESLPSEPVSDN